MVRRFIGVCAAALAVVALAGNIASAHVTTQPASLAKGSSDQLLSFAAPNESSTGAAVVGLEVDLPTDHPLLGVTALSQAGWSVDVTSTTLPKPVTTDDGQVTSAVSKVVWTATGSGIGADQFGLFTLLVGTVPSNTSALTFKAIQTYSDGTVVRWIEPIVKGTPAPDNPTPVLKLTKAPKS
jgi:uncharacterized protein YcnI